MQPLGTESQLTQSQVANTPHLWQLARTWWAKSALQHSDITTSSRLASIGIDPVITHRSQCCIRKRKISNRNSWKFIISCKRVILCKYRIWMTTKECQQAINSPGWTTTIRLPITTIKCMELSGMILVSSISSSNRPKSKIHWELPSNLARRVTILKALRTKLRNLWKWGP